MTISPKFDYKPRLVVMLKSPRAGQVKTRLGRDIGMTAAAWWFRHQVRTLLREVDDPRWQVVLALAPNRALAQRRIWPAHLDRVGQGSGDLGARMARIFRTMPRGPVAIIGGDIPDIRRSHIATAFRTLGHNDTVFGPATDGGYWLVGMKRIIPPPATLFQNVRWSTEHALSDSIATLKTDRIAMIDTLNDVDTAQDLAMLQN